MAAKASSRTATTIGSAGRDGTPLGMRVEIAVQDAAGARIAAEAGADRVELCSALAVGGLTPSIGLIRASVAVGLPVHVLVRARPGGFVYTSAEIDVMLSDILACHEAGAAGVVVGALTRNRALDVVAMKEMVDAARGMDITFHRAIDIAEFPFVVLDQLIDFGVRRVLTSGQAPNVGSGMSTLKRFVTHSHGHLEIQAGGGLTLADVSALAEAGVNDIHLSAKTPSAEAGPTGPGCGPAEFDVTDADLVRKIVKAARAI